MTMNLTAPSTWLRERTRQEKLELLAKYGSTSQLAKHCGVSDSFVRTELGIRAGKLEWSEDELVQVFERLKSVKLVAHMYEVSESEVRRIAEKVGLDITSLIDYSFGDNSNGKGRRAELEFARLRGNHIWADRNLVDGSQALWDFDDDEYRRVNVKSSRRWKYKAQTRKDNPFWWKISTNGREHADNFAVMCYDGMMKELVAWTVFPVSALGDTKSVTLQLQPDGLRIVGAIIHPS